MKDNDRKDEGGKKGDTHITERGRVNNRNQRHECSGAWEAEAGG